MLLVIEDLTGSIPTDSGGFEENHFEVTRFLSAGRKHPVIVIS